MANAEQLCSALYEGKKPGALTEGADAAGAEHDEEQGRDELGQSGTDGHLVDNDPSHHVRRAMNLGGRRADQRVS